MNLIAIVDSVGRVILGRHDEKSSNKTALSLRNPAVVNIQVNQESGQISVQLIPYIFREFVRQDKREEGVSWSFQKSAITVSNDLELEPTIIDQYARIFEVQQEVESVEPSSEPVELFDEAPVEAEVEEVPEAPDDLEETKSEEK